MINYSLIDFVHNDLKMKTMNTTQLTKKKDIESAYNRLDSICHHSKFKIIFQKFLPSSSRDIILSIFNGSAMIFIN